MLRLRHEKGVEAKVLTLVIGDVHRISTVSAFVHEFWAAPIEAGIGVWLLWRQVGPASLAVLAVAASRLSVLSSPDITEVRVNSVSSSLNGCIGVSRAEHREPTR
jgi:hypothetical protein